MKSIIIVRALARTFHKNIIFSKVSSHYVRRIIPLMLIACYLLFVTLPTYAADSTSSGGIADKLEQLKQDIASKASALRKEITQKLENKAFVGIVKTKSDNSLTLAAKAGTKIVSINQDTQYQDTTKKQKNFTLKTLKEEDNIAGLGDLDDTGVLVAKKVVLLPTSNSKQKTILWGQIISTSDKLITIRDKDSKTISLNVGSSTKIQKEGAKLTFKGLGVNDYIIATGYFGEDEETKKVGTLDTSFIYVTAAGGIVKPKEASPSATTKTSPTPTPKSTPTKSSKPSPSTAK